MSTVAAMGLYNYLLSRNIPGLKEKTAHHILKKGSWLYGAPQRFTDIYEIITGAVKLGSAFTQGKRVRIRDRYTG